MKFLALIPARYASTRFPGKPLADLMGKPMIQHVYEKAHAVFDACYVATDDPRIEQAVLSFGGRVVMTSSEHPSGTDRCREALVEVERETGTAFDVVVNIQGDEPFVSREQLELIQQCFEDSGTDIATLVKPFGPQEDVFNPNSQPFGYPLPARCRATAMAGRIQIPEAYWDVCLSYRCAASDHRPSPRCFGTV